MVTPITYHLDPYHLRVFDSIPVLEIEPPSGPSRQVIAVIAFDDAILAVWYYTMSLRNTCEARHAHNTHQQGSGHHPEKGS